MICTQIIDLEYVMVKSFVDISRYHHLVLAGEFRKICFENQALTEEISFQIECWKFLFHKQINNSKKGNL